MCTKGLQNGAKMEHRDLPEPVRGPFWTEMGRHAFRPIIYYIKATAGTPEIITFLVRGTKKPIQNRAWKKSTEKSRKKVKLGSKIVILVSPGTPKTIKNR